MATMIRMGCRSTDHFPQEISGDNGIGISATDATGGFLCDSAGTHVTDTTANSILPEFALILLQVHAAETGIDAFLFSLSDNFDGGGIPGSVVWLFGLCWHVKLLK
jgi:hypothetical protein